MVARDIAALAAIDPSATTERQLEAELRRPWARCWVARSEGGDAIAYLATWHVTDELSVMNIATRPDRRRQGIARAMMSAAMQYARDHGVARVFLEVRRSNSGAIALYRSVGFFAVGLRARYYGDGEDAVEMALHMDSAAGSVVQRPDEVAIDP